jgi:hypothetical protein
MLCTKGQPFYWSEPISRWRFSAPAILSKLAPLLKRRLSLIHFQAPRDLLVKISWK